MRRLPFELLASFRSILHRLPGPAGERGVTTVEYAIMLVLIAIAVAGSAPGIRDAVVNTFNVTADTLVNAGASS